MHNFGLIGKDIDYSFSTKFFTKKFSDEGINASYENCHLHNIEDFRLLIHKKKWKGFNVTIPYKEEIIPFLDELSDEALKIGAVNTIAFQNNKLIGHNTDYFGFLKSISSLIEVHHKKALILGTGGASKAVIFALNFLGIKSQLVSRNKANNIINYDELDKKVMQSHQLIINCSPLGTFPNENECPNIPYNMIGEQHLLYDLVYNPPITKFLELGKQQGAKILNGNQMLIEQALKAWEIWNK